MNVDNWLMDIPAFKKNIPGGCENGQFELLKRAGKKK